MSSAGRWEPARPLLGVPAPAGAETGQGASASVAGGGSAVASPGCSAAVVCPRPLLLAGVEPAAGAGEDPPAVVELAAWW